MMQFNMYHHYTLDEHLIRTVGVIAEIERGEADKIHPLSHRLFKTIQNRSALYLAAFLHDIGKGRKEDHSAVGAAIARRLGPRLGLATSETDMVVWLIEQHLVMSTYAQTRDVSDPKTIRDFAHIVGTPERLKLLLMLTVADIRAVGPGIWNGWKGQLLRTLYHQTEPLFAGAGVQPDSSERTLVALEAFRRAAAPEFSNAAIELYIARHYPDYWLKTETRKQIEHLRLVAHAEAEGRKFATDFATDAFTAVTELSVLAPNHPRLLSLFAGACAAAGANIVGAYISTTRDGFALDTFLLQREFDEDDERRRAQRIGDTIEKLLKGEVRLSGLMAKRHEAKGRLGAFTVEPEVVIDNTVSDHFTVLEVSGLDRPGLLYEITSAISNLSLDITSAHIATYGEKVVDVFYVTDLTNKKITAAWRQQAIRQRLIGILSNPARAGAMPA
jgi:[protein-PII] uridylyltransferase